MDMNHYGKTVWLIPDMYWPPKTSPDGDYVSHETICVLNPSDTDCEVKIVLYFQEDEPIEAMTRICPARRTKHIRLDQAEAGTIPRGLPYSAVVTCSVPSVVQYTRVDTSQLALSLSSILAYPIK
jgi:hypothetical protein